MNEHRAPEDQSNFPAGGKSSSEPLSAPEPQIVQINAKYRFRRHVLKCDRGDVVIWDLQKRKTVKGKTEWRPVANDRSPVRLGLYCAQHGILPAPENAKALSELARACQDGEPLP